MSIEYYYLEPFNTAEKAKPILQLPAEMFLQRFQGGNVSHRVPSGIGDIYTLQYTKLSLCDCNNSEFPLWLSVPPELRV